MKTEFFPIHHHEAGGADHLTPPLTTNSPSFHRGADHLTSPLATNQSSIFTTTFNNHPFSYLSLFNSTPSSTATTTNYLHLQNLHADSAQKMINAQILDEEQKMINAQILDEEQKMINEHIFYEEQKMINNYQIFGEQKMINAHILEEQKMMNNDQILEKMMNNDQIFGEQKMMNVENFEEQKMCVENDEKLKKRKEICVARRRRQKISERNSYLQKLLPWVTRMDIATMYDETANYIKFLQAQLSLLNSMPLYNTSPISGSSSFSGLGSGSYSGLGSDCFGNGGGMELLSKLSRQEVLRVMMNSPRVQTVLSRNGWCLYTAEQMEGML